MKVEIKAQRGEINIEIISLYSPIIRTGSSDNIQIGFLFY